ncbi:RNA polymerase sigma factor [Actinomadura opuntiae]|uniref:RNA polymerase sigma factor n=1 Tax=Actinomadura sp. OS1-43 TaxID=604315 RepID=UPI00255A876D|nr:sigma-70 family RNA polymerase sigma factor [Actinomadura sp. OS1-43]MDL4814166.1 sigma-70 family RNA polymerase sigma factor [Actinomadura sp. OS1-43]
MCNLARNRSRHLRIVRLRAPDPPEPQAAAEQLAIVREDHRGLLTALAALPPKQREALVLRYWLDLSTQEIAQTMSVSPGTDKTHISRGLAALGRRLEHGRA